MNNQDRIVKQFIELVQIDSETTKERKIADYLLQLFEQLGLEVKEDNTHKQTGHQAGNIIARLQGTDSDIPAIYFTAHMDTVVPGEAIKPVIKDEFIYSDGTTVLGADDKVGITAIVELIHLLKEQPLVHGDIYFAIMSGEESGLVGSQYFDESQLPVSFGYALDSDGEVGSIITAAPSQAKLFATIKGKAAHAGVQPEKGVSAISMTAKAITKMPLGRIDEETTANVGSFEGKGPTNVVCDRVLLIAEARSLSKDKLEKQVEAMCTALNESTANMGGEVDIEIKHMYPNYQFDENDQVVQVAIKAASALGKKSALKVSGGGSDANHLSGKGIPTVNLAVGYENIHTKNERISIASLKEVPLYMYEIVKQLSK
ncbi:M20/M25/M40 family metallo-hydrolase [Gracilibacillus caseinilyticus]|uniref:M20/M25/M40 family metallo-hydrolase n=1 Tax=Gracilibacillus caseinilyticus TaxID=2932256 RepID=A0ABY4ESW6_9BACI|nr:M20/M25/M40 family metallo-hydrolase [Gracilibacillus caseinilyticus]UOQ47514.1 M20/M25/M40 family metallo-hydrolase [Gracilibacillus caseinilyticus]